MDSVRNNPTFALFQASNHVACIVVLIISAFWTVSIMLVVLNFSEQIGDT